MWLNESISSRKDAVREHRPLKKETLEPRQVPDLARPALVVNAGEESEVIY